MDSKDSPSGARASADEERNPEDTITVEALLDLVPQLGIPHFQRGLVWSTASTSALLESLFWNTPCGSLIFWTPPSPADYGDPLLPSDQGNVKRLVVDGQQRIRCLYEALRGGPDGGEATEENGDDPSNSHDSASKRTWFLNLTRLPDLQGHVMRLGKEYSLFVYTADPLDPNHRSPLKHSLIPLARILTDGRVDQYERPSFDGPVSAEAEQALERAYARARSILERKFFQVVLDTESVVEIVSVYNRINSGGLRVETEERAFARLVSLDSKTYWQVKKTFELFHPEKSEPGRDEVMKRRRERNFGFKTFLRSFVQTCSYHFGRSLGSQGFSFGVLESEDFARRLPGGDQAAALSVLWDESRRWLDVTRRLMGELGCDDLAFLPEVSSLSPFFQLLIQFNFEKHHDPLLTWTLLAFMLRPPVNQREWLKQVRQVREWQGNGLAALESLAKEADDRARDALEDDETLREANSIQNRYVLLLYWLVRWKGARDFSYKNVPASQLAGTPERPVKREYQPEKQHIIPFSKLTRFYRDADVRRGSSHSINNIANFTYISRELNGLKALAEKLITLEHDPPDELAKHFLWDENNRQGGVQECFKDLSRLLGLGQGSACEADVHRAYEEFCHARRALIRRGFLEWLDYWKGEASKVLETSPLDGLDETKAVRRKDQLYSAQPPSGKDQAVGNGRKKRTKMTERDFPDSKTVDLFQSLSAEWKKLGLKPARSDGCISFRMKNPLGRPSQFTLFLVSKNGEVSFHYLPQQLEQARLPVELGKQYFSEVRGLFPNAQDPVDVHGKFSIGTLDAIASKSVELCELLKHTMNSINDAAKGVGAS